jgi:hypothetical protein
LKPEGEIRDDGAGARARAAEPWPKGLRRRGGSARRSGPAASRPRFRSSCAATRTAEGASAAAGGRTARWPTSEYLPHIRIWLLSRHIRVRAGF